MTRSTRDSWPLPQDLSASLVLNRHHRPALTPTSPRTRIPSLDRSAIRNILARIARDGSAESVFRIGLRLIPARLA